MSSIKYLNFKFFDLKLWIKNKFIVQIVIISNLKKKIDMHVKNIKIYNLMKRFNIFKIHIQ